MILRALKIRVFIDFPQTLLDCQRWIEHHPFPGVSHERKLEASFPSIFHPRKPALECRREGVWSGRSIGGAEIIPMPEPLSIHIDDIVPMVRRRFFGDEFALQLLDQLFCLLLDLPLRRRIGREPLLGRAGVDPDTSRYKQRGLYTSLATRRRWKTIICGYPSIRSRWDAVRTNARKHLTEAKRCSIYRSDGGTDGTRTRDLPRDRRTL
jgi:hypothetical protein